MTSLALAENRVRQFLALTKPRVVSLIVFCAVIGMFLAVPGLPPAGIVLFATLGGIIQMTPPPPPSRTARTAEAAGRCC